MYFSDAYSEPTEEDLRIAKAAERRLLLRIVVISSISLVLLAIALI